MPWLRLLHHRSVSAVRHRSGARHHRWAALVGAAGIAVMTQANCASASTPTLLGAVGDVGGISSAGRTVGTHAYAHLNQKVPNGRMITMRSDGSWKAVAAAGPGSAIYGDLVRWANTLKSRPGPILFAYHHEPEASGSVQYGSPADFIAAYRHVVSVFRAQGVNNVEYVWQMTSWSFAAAPSDRRTAANWYPGSAYVDGVGSDAYNWYNCGPGRGKWEDLSTVLNPSLSFARSHGKPLVVAEFASQNDPRRAQWVRNAHAYFLANTSSIRGVYYFQHVDTGGLRGCDWFLRSQDELNAFAELSKDTVHFAS